MGDRLGRTLARSRWGFIVGAGSNTAKTDLRTINRIG